MRIKVLLIVFGCLGQYASYAQVFNLTQEIKLHNKTYRLDSLLLNISKQTGLIFSYSPDKVKAGQTIKIINDSYNLTQILLLLKTQIGLDSKIFSDHIILSPEAYKVLTSVKSGQVPAQKKPVHENPPATSKNQEIVKDIKISSTGTPSVSNYSMGSKAESLNSIQSDIVKNLTEDSVTLSSTNEAVDSTKTNKYGIDAPIERKDSIKTISFKAIPPKKWIIKSDSSRNNYNVEKSKTPITIPWLAKAGISLDESTGLGSTINLGLSYAYGTVAFQTNFNTNQFRVGAGTSFNVNKKFWLGANWSTGNLKKEFIVDSALNIFERFSITVNSQLSRFGVFVEFPLSRLSNLFLQISPQYNILKSSYLRNSYPIYLDQLGPNAKEYFLTIKPPYTIYEKSKVPSDHIQTWVGIQVTLLYKINFKRKRG